MRKLIALLLMLPLLATAQREYDYRYWFDSQPDGPLASSGRSSHSVLTLNPDVSTLREGLHTFNFYVVDVAGGGVTSLHSNYFLKLSPSLNQTYRVQTLIDGIPYRMDEVNPSGLTLRYDLDATSLPYGLHKLSVAIISESGAVSSFYDSMFFRVATDAENSAMMVHYLIDGKEVATAPLNNGAALLNLDVAEIGCGVHELTVYASDGNELTTNFASRLFVKTPGPISSYRYWLNDDIAAAKTVNLPEAAEEFSLISMLPVDEVPFRTHMFTCEPDATTGGLTLFARNELFAAFFATRNEAMVIDSRSFTDRRVSRTVPAADIHPLEIGISLTETIGATNAETIVWRYFDADPGHLFNIRSSINCQIDVFGPDGEPVMQVESPESDKTHSFRPEKSGRYYVALHDFSNKTRQSVVTYTNLPTHAVVNPSPATSANEGIYFVNLSGNGMNDLKSLTLKGNGTELTASYCAATTNQRSMARFDLNGLPTGKYSIVAEFVDSTGVTSNWTIEKAVTLQDVKKGEIKVSYQSEQHLNETPSRIVTVKVQNSGNKPYYYVPFNIAARQLDGCAISFMNFSTLGLNGEEPRIYHTDNLLGLGVKGAMYPSVIPYIGPYQTLTFKLGITGRQDYWVYAWCGEPWSEEADRIFNNIWEINDSHFTQQNMLSFTQIFLMKLACVLDESNAESDSAASESNEANGPLRVPVRRALNNNIDFGRNNYDRVRDVAEQLVEMADRPSITQPYQAAQTVANLSVAHGQMIGGYVNMLQLRNIEAQMQACGLDLNDPNGINGDFYYLYEAREEIKNRIPSPGDIVRTATNDDDLADIIDSYMDSTAESCSPAPRGISGQIRVISFDPNDILGYVDPSGSNYVGIGVSELPYSIEFENDPELATAPALTIDIDNQLDGNVFDLSTFRATELTIGNKSVELPEGHEFIRTLDMRPDINAVAQLELNYDSTSGRVRWHLTSLDPMTMEPTDYLEQGILPVNDSISHRGEGMVSYSINLKPGLKDGTVIKNSASIVFDVNSPIETPVWENILDYNLPTSELKVFTADNRSFDFTFSGEDSGSGVWRYALYMRQPGSDDWRLLRDGIEQPQITYEAPEALAPGTIFAVLATDGAGNIQDSEFMHLKTGDVDRSGVIDANDVLALSAYYMGKKVNIALSVSDVNSDGVIDSQDVLAIARIYLQNYPTKQLHIRTRKYSNHQ